MSDYQKIVYSKRSLNAVRWQYLTVVFCILCLLVLIGKPWSAIAADSSGIVSDDFNSATLNTALWTIDDPLGDAGVTITGAGTGDAKLLFSVPAGASHDLWVPDTAPKLLQAANDTDFSVEAKFDSSVTKGYQGQGIIVEKDANNWLRFDFFSNGSNVYIYSASNTNGTLSTKIYKNINLSAPMYLRVDRSGDVWTEFYSSDGTNWTAAGSFTYAMIVTAIGPFVSNYSTSGNAPAFTSIIDYFFNRASPIVPEDGAQPVITIWYGGDNQRFGDIGTPQRWINVLGNISNSSNIESVTYALNGGPDLSLSLGPDNARLVNQGDFNVELPVNGMLDGTNTVEIKAMDIAGNQIIDHVVSLNYNKNTVWPLPYQIDWSAVNSISDVAQVVDGLWDFDYSGGIKVGIRPVYTGYDRLVAIGDIAAWDNYVAEVPITIHSVGSSTTGGGNDPSVGLGIRWQGHTADGNQPSTRYYPVGGFAFYRYHTPPDFELWRDSAATVTTTSGTPLTIGVTYIFKYQVYTIANTSYYSFKVWKQGDPEPSSWLLTLQEGIGIDLSSGSLLLIAHKVDATFGNITVTPYP